MSYLSTGARSGASAFTTIDGFGQPNSMAAFLSRVRERGPFIQHYGARPEKDLRTLAGGSLG